MELETEVPPTSISLVSQCMSLEIAGCSYCNAFPVEGDGTTLSQGENYFVNMHGVVIHIV